MASAAGRPARARLAELLTPGGLVAPVAIPLVARWATWLLAVGILAFGGGSPRSRALVGPLIGGSLALLLLGSLLLARLFGRGWPGRRRAVALLAAVDLGQSLLLVGLEGGWNAAFYEYAMTSVMLPAYLFGALGMAVAASTFSLGFLGILLAAPEPGRSLEYQLAAVLNPWIVGAVVAVLADLLRRLERATARNLELAASRERWRIAREIHDGVAQQSYVLALGLQTAAELAERGDLAALRRSLPPLEQLARQALLEVRQYVAEGRPLMLGEVSLRAGLAGLAREFSTVTGIAIEVETPGGEVALPPVQQNALYRLAQEALANVFKHAEARHAWVRLRVDGQRAALEVEDDGRGFDPARSGEGFGLEGMRRRVAELGGSFAVESRPAGGSRVRATIPLEGVR